jgi:chaperone BCS1
MALQWLTKHALKSGNHFSAQSLRPGGTKLVPSPGVHYLRWGGAWIKVVREREKGGALLDLSTGMPFETVQLTILGRRFDLFARLLEEAQLEARQQTEGRLLLYTSFAAEWRPFGNPRRRRPLGSVILAEGNVDAIMADVREFLSSGQWYLDRGIPYRRGYLLHGPPGTGKSSLVQAIASELGYGICILNLADGVVTDDRLGHLLNALPERTILLLEDIDAVSIDGQQSPAQHGMGRLTLSGLLNALDGVGSSEERLVFMTTNHYDSLAPVLIRPGRIDVKMLVGLADADQVRRMFARFYPDQRHLADSFVAELKGASLSPASIQGHFIRHKTDPPGAVRHAHHLLS